MANEAMLRSFHDMYALDYVALRYFNVYGPRMDVFGKYTEVLIRWLDCLDRGEAPKIFGDGRQTMDFVYVADVARANLLALESDVSDEVFNVASGVETSLLQLLQTLLRVTVTKMCHLSSHPERAVNRRPAPPGRHRPRPNNARFPLAGLALDDGLRHLVAWRRDALALGRSNGL